MRQVLLSLRDLDCIGRDLVLKDMAASAEDIQSQIYGSGSITRTAYQVCGALSICCGMALRMVQYAIGIFFGLSVTSVVARVGIRIKANRKLSLDDYFVLFGLGCLSAATAIAYKNCNNVFIGTALQVEPGAFSKWILAYSAICCKHPSPILLLFSLWPGQAYSPSNFRFLLSSNI